MMVKRYRPLVAAHAISQQTYDDAVAAEHEAQADVPQYLNALGTVIPNASVTVIFSVPQSNIPPLTRALRSGQILPAVAV